MPNHVANVIRMDHIQEEPLYSLDGSHVYFDFNKLVPMPESLNIESSNKQDVAIELCLRRLNTGGFTSTVISTLGLKCNCYNTMSDEEFQKKRSVFNITDDELAEFGLQVICNKVRYGSTDWYDWSCDNWGTKWNSYNNLIDEETPDRIKFNTAWGAPHMILEKLAQMYPHAVIQHWWAEEFMGSGNSGYMLYKNGQILGGYDKPNSYDSYVHSAFCWDYTDQYIEPSNVIYLLGDGNVIKDRWESNVIRYIQQFTFEETGCRDLSYKAYKDFYDL